MPRGKHNKNNGISRGGPSRGGTARGSSNIRRGFRGRGGGRGFRGRGGYIPSSDTDFVLQVWENNNYDSHYSYSSPRGRGRGIGPVTQTSSPPRGYDSPGRGGRGRGRGRGGFDSPGRGDFRPTNPNAPLSMLLRPLLRPVIFVPATQHRFLFRVEEELIQPIVEQAGNTEKSHVPTADKIARVFSGNFKPTPPETDDDNSNEDLEEIDFADVGKFQEAVDSLASAGKVKLVEQVAEETFTGKFRPVIQGSSIEPPDTPDPSLQLVSQPNLDAVMAEPDGTVGTTSETTSVKVTITETEVSNTVKVFSSPTIQFEDIQEDVEAVQETPGFFIDVDPSNSPYENVIPISDRISGPELGSVPDDDGDDIVVYVAPHPRPGRKVPTPVETSIEPMEIRTTSVLTGLPIGTVHVPDPGIAPTMDSISFSFGSGAREVTDMNVDSTTPRRSSKPPVFTARRQTPAKVKSRQRGQWAVKQRRHKETSSFAARGADVSEAQLTNWKRDPRRDERRRGDSDVDWGDDDEGDDDEWEDEKEEEAQVISVGGLLSVVSSARTRSSVKMQSGAEGMDVDPDLEIDVDVMKRFVDGMGPSGSRHLTMDDLADEQRMREEDENGDSDGTSEEEEKSDEDEDEDEDDELEEILNLEERMLIAESTDDDNDDEDDEDDQSPNASFQARLERLRKESSNKSGKRKNKGKGKAKALYTDEDPDSTDDDAWIRNRSWAEEDDDFIAHINDILDKNEEIISGQDRKSKKKIFTAVFNGDFEDVDMWKPARKAKDKYKDLPPELLDLWKKDRAKKALFKKERELARLAAAADPLVLNRGGKKGRKAMIAAAKLDPTITVLPNRVIDMTTLVQQIKRFIDDIGGPNTMSLPPANKQTRKEVHELAKVFGLKSQSRGKDASRYTTLTKTTKSGVGVNHKKVAKIVRRTGLSDNAEFVGGSDIWKKHAERAKGMPKHREGDEVGKTAPKINETNIGFKMLASMGWSDGAPIGLSGGLRNPLTAVIKNTKLGLGAAK